MSEEEEEALQVDEGAGRDARQGKARQCDVMQCNAMQCNASGEEGKG